MRKSKKLTNERDAEYGERRLSDMAKIRLNSVVDGTFTLTLSEGHFYIVVYSLT